MKRGKRLLLAGLLALAVCCLIWYGAFSPSSGEEPTASVYLEGELLYSIDLSQVESGYSLPVGEGNTLRVEPDGVRMEWANCPDQLCVKQGKISKGGRPIVCLPNQVMVTIGGEEGGGEG
jgi:hypothetical protein